MAFVSKVEQLRVTCISFALEFKNGDFNRTSKEVVEDAEAFYQWIIKGGKTNAR